MNVESAMPLSARPAPPKKDRIIVLDQLRGYAIFGMILVNYLGQFDSMPEIFKHHRQLQDYWPFGFTYADTIAPLFIFVVGMGFRLSLPKRAERFGIGAARWQAFKRYCVLILVGAVFCGLEWQWIWDALVDIGFGGLLALPFIERSGKVRIAAAVFYAALYQAICSYTGYFEWTMKNSIDGGPLGIFSWASILLFGTIAYDLVATRDHRKILVGSLAWGVGLFALGWLLRIGWGEIKEPWHFTQRAMLSSYTMGSAGTSFLALFAFYLVNEVGKFQFPGFSVIGKNPLTIYLVQYSLLGMYGTFPQLSDDIPLFPEDSGVLWATVGFVVFYLFNYAVAWRLHKDDVIIRL
jgi:predicted acyltransferase